MKKIRSSSAFRRRVKHHAKGLLGAFAITTGFGMVFGADAAVGQSSLEYQIYSALLDAQYTQVSPDTFFVADNTVTAFMVGHQATPVYEQLAREMSLPPSSLIDEYVSLAGSELSLNGSLFSASLPVKTIPIGSRQDVTVAAFSRIALSADSTQAVVHEYVSCGERCSLGFYVYVSLVNSVWEIAEVKRTIGPH